MGASDNAGTRQFYEPRCAELLSVGVEGETREG